MKKILFFGLCLLATFAVAQDPQKNNLTKSDPRFDELISKLARGDYGHVEYEIPKSFWSYGKCEKDRFTNVKYCEMRKDELIVIISNGRKSVYIIGADYPNKSSALKIDNNKTIWGVEGTFTANNAIIEEMRKGKTAYTRHMKWPYEINVDRETDISDFREALDKLVSKYSQL